MLREFFDKVMFELRSHTAEQNGRFFLFQPHRNRYEEVLGQQSEAMERNFDTLRGMADFLKNYAHPNEAGIYVSPSSVSARLMEVVDKGEAADVLLKFDFSTLPPKESMDIRRFREYLEKLEDSNEPAADLRAKLKSFEGVQTTSVKLDEGEGPFQSITYETTEGARGKGPQLPRFLNLQLRFGTREMALVIRYRLEVTIKPLTFRLVQIETDQAIYDRFVETVVEKLSGLLGEGWRIYEGDGPLVSSNSSRAEALIASADGHAE
jgi:hypothetical protein